MNTITVAVPKKIAQKYGKQIVNYSDLISFVSESLWFDTDVSPKIEMDEFYALVKNSNCLNK